MTPSPRGFPPLAALTILLSAFLLFQVQPLISKAILPWFGGSPAVWSTCMLFFQLLLLAGYAYAHLLTRLPSGRLQMAIHLVLLIAALAMLPITPNERWKPLDGDHPTERILWVLAISVGIPYFLLSTTGPLVQAWSARATGGASPYRLYALSNVGSLAALVTYPFFFERLFDVPTQGRVWSIAFVVFAMTCGVVSSLSARGARGRGPALETGPGDRLAVGDWLAWILLPALAVVALLAVTNHLCRDVAVVPFLWIAPLTLYLLSFIICFDRETWYARRWWSLVAWIACLLVFNVLLAKHMDSFCEDMRIAVRPSWYLRNVMVEGSIYLAWLFLACMICHGELVQRKPHSRHLTTFYLCVAAGGALGGVFVALLCPRIFTNYWELSLSVGCVYLVAACALAVECRKYWIRRSRPLLAALLLAIATGAFLWTWSVVDTMEEGIIARTRNFYGVLTVKEHYTDDPLHHGYGLYNGRILHGFQYADPARRKLPITYYEQDAGPGIIIARLRAARGPLRFGVVGLGTGTMAAFGREGDQICFYEIDPEVIAIQDQYFTYLKDCPAEKRIELGDARIQMERQEPMRFDALFIDAFSGDAVPTHLLTREALVTYVRHLKPDGVIAFHISNRYLDLNPVILGMARDAEMGVIKFLESSLSELYDTSSDWVALTNSVAFLTDPVVLEKQAAFTSPKGILWTDQYSNLWDVLE